MGVSSLNIRLPDGKILEVASGSTTADVAGMIGPGLARSAVAGKISRNGQSETIDLKRPIPGDCDLKILTVSDTDADSLYVLRHSAAHVMAEAICTLFPETKLAYGPPLEDGFYYDIDLSRSITPDDFPRIEAEMARIVKEDRPFCRYEVQRSDAMSKLRDEGNRYKVDNAERAEGDALSFYVTGANRGRDFEDFCRGPHIPSTSLIKAFKIRQVSRSHYRGDVNDQPLQRVYGTAFYKKASLEEYLKQVEEAKKRDHRVLGRELDLFHIDETVGQGLILWMPKGAIVRTELQAFLTAEMQKLGYSLVYTPHIGRLKLYRTSGHFPYYKDAQYPPLFESDWARILNDLWEASNERGDADGYSPKESALLDEIERNDNDIGKRLKQKHYSPAAGMKTHNRRVVEELLEGADGYLLKPMNCPHHIKIYAARQRSYRDLPFRLAEYGTVYRYEQSGEIGGLTRVRGFTQDDAHLFCTTDQLGEELLTTVKLTRHVLETLNLTEYQVRVGLRDPKSDKYVGSSENWAKSEQAIRDAAKQSGIPFTEEIGEAAFYGPKIDFMVKDCIGRNWQLGTVQADYNLPERFDLTYIGADNAQHRPVMVHRAPFGSMERFIGILIEHFAGAFPLWLSPVQVAVTSVSEKSEAFARRVHETLHSAGLRSVLDITSEKIGPKKHRHRTEKVNYILVVGEQEAAAGNVNVNDREGKSLGNMSLEGFVAACKDEINSKGQRCISGSPSRTQAATS
ncbi:MAG: threonine--tRNA ligase [Planctomycetes bacterium]|nr:threonine--tRNA ligase [Planctomycetota bacterium]